MANQLGSYSWGVTNSASAYTTYSTYNNNWETANANILLNEYFLNATNTSATYGSCSDWTYYYGITDNANMYKTNDCSYILKYGIPTSTANDYIQPVTWYLKGYSDATYSKQDMYTCERSDQTAIQKCTGGGNNGTYATKVTNKRVGLIYPSDYMYASGYYSSTDTTAGSSQYYGQQNWLYNGGEWTITPKGYDSSAIINLSGIVWLINGGVNTTFGYISNTVRPTFYLKSSVQYVSGSGSFSDPFIISCDTCNN